MVHVREHAITRTCDQTPDFARMVVRGLRVYGLRLEVPLLADSKKNRNAAVDLVSSAQSTALASIRVRPPCQNS